MCDTLCVRGDGAMWFAKNSDRHPDEPQVVEWHVPRDPGPALHTQYLTLDDPGAHAFLGSRPTWLWGVEHGVNEYGVAIGNEKIWTVDRPRDHPAALLGMDLVRLGLERARTAGEALTVMAALIEQHGQGGSGEPHRDEPYYSSFLVADPREGFVIETSNHTWAARPVGAGAAISNRVSLATDWTLASPDVPAGTDFDIYRWERMPTAIADQRLAVTRAAVARAGPTRAADLARTMRNHGSARNDDELPGGDAFSVCMHRRDSYSQTTASIIAELRADAPTRAWVALGNPCTSVYVPCFPPAISPELADAAQWQRFARLRDLVEAEPDRLAEVRATLVPVERALWEEGESVYASGDRVRVDAFARTAFAAVAAALHRLGV